MSLQATIAATISAPCLVIMALALADGPPAGPIDADGVPQRQYLTIVMCYGRAECDGMCRIENRLDQSSMPCEEWFGRYCPASSANATCKALLAEVGSAAERD